MPGMAHGFDSFLEMPRDLPVTEEASHQRLRSFEAFSREHYSALLYFLRLRVANEEDAKDAPLGAIKLVKPFTLDQLEDALTRAAALVLE